MESKQLAGFKKWGTLITLSLALAIIIIDGTVLNVSTRNIILDLHTDLKSIQWAITLYSLVVAALTITGGRLGDLFGRKRMFVLGASIFTFGSFLTSISPNVGILIIGWSIIEGVGAALMMPATAALLISNFHGKERAFAFGVWGGIAGAAAAFGPILGGFLTTNYGWNWAFRINIFVAIILIAGTFIIKESRDVTHRPQLDLIGVLLSALGLGSVIYGIIESSTYGWLNEKLPYDFNGASYDLFGLSISLYTIILGLIILCLFFVWENYREKKELQPLLSLGIFKNRQFSSGLFTTGALALGQSGLIFAIPVFFQSVKGRDAFQTGLALLPLSLSLLIAAPISGILSSRFKPKTLIQFGIILNLIGAILIYLGLSLDADIINLAPGQILFGAGFGFVSAQISNLTLSAVDVKKIGEASGVNSMIRQLGASLGAALIGAIFLSSFTATFTTGVNDSNLNSYNKQDLITKVNKDSSQFQYASDNGNPKIFDIEQENIRAVIKKVSDQSTVNGAKQAQIYVALFTIICLIISFSLPSIKKVHKDTKILDQEKN